MRKFVFLVFVFSSLVASAIDRADIQFFGDVYLPYHVLKRTKTSLRRPHIFSGTRALLEKAELNVINFEGVATGARFSFDITKSFLLKMPLWTGRLLKSVGVDVANLANNHAYDYGYQGLFDSISTLEKSDIRTLGAGDNLREASAALVMNTSAGSVCMLGYSRTLPASFYAKSNRAGTSSMSFTATGRQIRSCALRHDFTFVMFHWGQEKSEVPKKYQRQLARLAIDKGATAVIGHHPHVLQSLEIYKGKPIFYSLGNYAFGTLTTNSMQEGAVARFRLGKAGKLEWFELFPLAVNNRDVKFIPRFVEKRESNLEVARFISSRRCEATGTFSSWRCT